MCVVKEGKDRNKWKIIVVLTCRSGRNLSPPRPSILSSLNLYVVCCYTISCRSSLSLCLLPTDCLHLTNPYAHCGPSWCHLRAPLLRGPAYTLICRSHFRQDLHTPSFAGSTSDKTCMLSHFQFSPPTQPDS